MLVAYRCLKQPSLNALFEHSRIRNIPSDVASAQTSWAPLQAILQLQTPTLSDLMSGLVCGNQSNRCGFSTGVQRRIPFSWAYFIQLSSFVSIFFGAFCLHLPLPIDNSNKPYLFVPQNPHLHLRLLSPFLDLLRPVWPMLGSGPLLPELRQTGALIGGHDQPLHVGLQR